MEMIDDGLIQFCSCWMMKTDCETLKFLLTKYQDFTFICELMPFAAMFSVEALNYLEKTQGPIGYEINSPIRLEATRMKLKQYSERYRKSLRIVNRINELEDDFYTRDVSMQFVIDNMLYDNLGIYTLPNGEIIGNTQLASYYLRNDITRDNEIDGAECFDFGYVNGQIIGSISEGLRSIRMRLVFQEFEAEPYYQDFNTYYEFSILPNDEDGIEISLIILNMLTHISYINNFLAKIVPKDNLWLFKVKYINVYYIFRSIEKLWNNIKQRKIPDRIRELMLLLLDIDEEMFNSSFRSCMMHYSLKNDKKGKVCIDDDKFDIGIPLFGLIETCFPGYTFETYNDKLTKMCESEERLLKRILDLKLDNIQPLND